MRRLWQWRRSRPGRRHCPRFSLLVLLEIFQIYFSFASQVGGGGGSGSGEESRDFARPPIPIPNHCDDLPPLPMHPTRDMLELWGADDVDGGEERMHTPEGDIPAFDWSDGEERARAEMYKACELPFKFFNVPDLRQVMELWTDEYLSRNIESSPYSVSMSQSNRFLYYDEERIPDNKGHNFPPPLQTGVPMSFDEWLEIATRADEEGLATDAPHWYLQTRADRRGPETNFVKRDLQFFSANSDSSDYWIPVLRANKGTQCRFGMRGIAAASHFDGSRNYVAILRGKKRYMLHPPSSCENLGIIPYSDHPSFRHTYLDWSTDWEEQAVGGPVLGDAMGLQTILSAGEILYIPSFWFHYIVSLNYNIQCNTRHGLPIKPIRKREASYIRSCFQKGRRDAIYPNLGSPAGDATQSSSESESDDDDQGL